MTQVLLFFFIGMIQSQGDALNHHLTAVDYATPVDPSVSWLNFVQLCGSAAQEAPKTRSASLP